MTAVDRALADATGLLTDSERLILAAYRDMVVYRELAHAAFHRLAALQRELAAKDDIIAALRTEIRQKKATAA